MLLSPKRKARRAPILGGAVGGSATPSKHPATPRRYTPGKTHQVLAPETPVSKRRSRLQSESNSSVVAAEVSWTGAREGKIVN